MNLLIIIVKNIDITCFQAKGGIRLKKIFILATVTTLVAGAVAIKMNLISNIDEIDVEFK